jgi:hypothetical protein
MTETGSQQNAKRPPEGANPPERARLQLWERMKRVVSRSLLWSYERGTWQYDVMVIVILAIIFLTPRAWYDDRPTLQLTDLRHRQGLLELGRGKDGWRYLIDSRLVESFAAQKPEDALQEILRRRLNRPFKIQSIDEVRDKNNVVLGYTVVVTQ